MPEITIEEFNRQFADAANKLFSKIRYIEDRGWTQVPQPPPKSGEVVQFDLHYLCPQKIDGEEKIFPLLEAYTMQRYADILEEKENDYRRHS